MSLLPRKEKNICHLGKYGATQMFSWMCIFPAPCRQLGMRVKMVMMTFAANLQRLTTHKTHPLIVERPALSNTAQLSLLASRQV